MKEVTTNPFQILNFYSRLISIQDTLSEEALVIGD